VLDDRRVERERHLEGARTEPLPGGLQACRGRGQSRVEIEGR
jgi:hypothetical protein